MAKPDVPRSLRRGFRGLRKWVRHENEAIAVLSAEAIGAWRVAGKDELATLQNGSCSAAVKQALAVALAQTNGQRFEKPLTELAVTPRDGAGDMGTRCAAAAGLAHSNLSVGVKAAVELLTKDPQGADPVRVVKSLLQQRDGARLLTSELRGSNIHPAVMASLSKFYRDSGVLPGEIAEAFSSPTTGSLSATLLAEDIDALTADVEKHGNAAKGELIYRRKAVACTSCHAVGSAGAEIGPNLVAVGAAAKTKYLVESILSPNAAIAEHYETRTFVLDDGTLRTGIVTFRNKKEVVVRDSAESGKEVRIAVNDIDEELPAKSLMPAGLADQLRNRSEFLDLAKFVSVLGKPGEYANDESPVIRKWRVISAAKFDDLPDDNAAGWLSAYSKVSGELPAEDFPSGDYIFARGFVNVLAAGSVRLKINSITGLQLWVDGNPVADLEAPIRLGKRRHSLTLGVDAKQHATGLRVELQAVDARGKFQPEGGR